MSNELMVTPVAAARAVGDTAGQPRVAAGESAVAPKQASASLPAPNPSLQLDPALGLVVIEFRNDAGNVTASIPSERVIQAYQRWQTTHFGPAPHGMNVTSTGNSGAADLPGGPTRVRATSTTPAKVALSKRG